MSHDNIRPPAGHTRLGSLAAINNKVLPYNLAVQGEHSGPLPGVPQVAGFCLQCARNEEPTAT